MNKNSCFGQDNKKQYLRSENMMKRNIGLMMGAVGGVVMLFVAGAMLTNTKAARRRRTMRRAMKTMRNVGCAMQKLASF